MTAEQSAMMGAAHTVTGGAVGLMAAIFIAGVALYLWSRRRE